MNKRKPSEDEEDLPCTESMESIETPGHMHNCVGGHFESVVDHFCGDCRKWWGKAGNG